MTTTTLNVSLPDDLRDVVKDRVARGGFADHNDYISNLIRQDAERAARERLEAHLVSRADDSDAVDMDAADIQGMREELHRRIAARNGT
jgi:Arc/MetJ-type ribon-helix-helix transcriptional regulator